jgi:hypothetical protein
MHFIGKIQETEKKSSIPKKVPALRIFEFWSNASIYKDVHVRIE